MLWSKSTVPPRAQASATSGIRPGASDRKEEKAQLSIKLRYHLKKGKDSRREPFFFCIKVRKRPRSKAWLPACHRHQTLRIPSCKPTTSGILQSLRLHPTFPRSQFPHRRRAVESQGVSLSSNCAPRVPSASLTSRARFRHDSSCMLPLDQARRP